MNDVLYLNGVNLRFAEEREMDMQRGFAPDQKPSAAGLRYDLRLTAECQVLTRESITVEMPPGLRFLRVVFFLFCGRDQNT